MRAARSRIFRLLYAIDARKIGSALDVLNVSSGREERAFLRAKPASKILNVEKTDEALIFK